MNRRAGVLLRGSLPQPSMRTPPRGRTLLFSTLLLLVLASPYASASGGRDADVSVYSDSLGKEASPGEPAEYIITVTNNGDDDISVQLSTSQEAGGCQGYTSAIEQVPGTISAHASEQVTLTVNVTDDSSEQVADTCETVVTASATVVGTPGAPGQDDVTVTTTKADGSGNTAYAVELSSSQPTKNYDGEEFIEWSVTVKNTGQAQGQQTISLDMTDLSSCRSDGLSATVDPTSVQLGADDEEVVIVSVDVPEGEQTEAGSHCFIIHAEVTTDPNPQDKAQDNMSLTLNIPELHECDATLSPSSMTLAPGASQSGTFELTNEGNSDWTVNFGKSGAKSSWVTPSTSTRSLPYDNGNGEASFTFDVNPDDSLPADSTTQIRIQALDGNDERCYAMLSMTVGQSYGAAISLSNDALNNVDPGTSASTQLTITNQGNGQDSFSIGHSPVPAGWSVNIASSSVTLQGKHASQNDRQTNVEVAVFVPTDALADEMVTITLTVSSSGDSSVSSSEELEVSVAERHALSASVLSLDQTGRSDQTILFPVTISNDGNVRDSFRLRACDPNQPGSSCASPSWSSRFVDAAGQQITQIALDAGGSQQVFLEITISSEDEGDYLQVEIKVNIVAAPAEEYKVTVTARVSNYDYMMQLILADPQGAPDSTAATLPPGGEITIQMTLTDIGTSPYVEAALFTVEGMDSTISREMTVNGLGIEIGSMPFEIPDDGQGYLVEITLSVLAGVPNGEAGVIQVCAASMRNTAEPSCVAVVLTVATVHDLSVEVVGGAQRNITHPDFADFTVIIYNGGNVDEQIEISSTEGLRGWTIDIRQTDLSLDSGQSAEILVRVKPPVKMSIEDEFEFTLIVTPESAPVAAQPIDITVTATLDKNMFGFSAKTWDIVSWVLISTIGLAIVGTVLSNRFRSELR